jgi:hypothetical protein
MHLRASHSSVGLFKGCQRRYFHYKVAKTKIDSDASNDTRALRIGSCTHKILEDSNHEGSNITKAIMEEAFREEKFPAGDQDRIMIMVMVEKYLQLHKKSQLSIIVCEIEIGDDDVIGYVDAVMGQSDGGWWIVDLKTAARLGAQLLSSLHKDPQLNLYSSYAPQIAEKLGLDLDKFMGIRYRVMTKSVLKKKNLETSAAFRLRLLEKIESYDIAIPVEDMDPEATKADTMRTLDQMRGLLRMKESDVPQNFGNCFNYFRPCQWWSHCYKKPFTEAAKTYIASDSKNMLPVTTGKKLSLIDHI